MNLLFHLARSSRAVFVTALITSVLGGLAASLLVSSINESLNAAAGALPGLGLRFALIGATMMFFRRLSQSKFVELSEKSLAELRKQLSRHFAEAPYPTLEARGGAGMLAILTEDVATVADFFVTLPRFSMHGAVVLGCLGYLAWLSPQVFILPLALIGLGLLGHVWSGRRARRHLERARSEQDALFSEFRALFSGAKELKLHRSRREAFVSGVLASRLESVRRNQARGLREHAASGSARSSLFYVMIGVVLFALGPGVGVDEKVRSGYALMFLYMMLPLHALVEASPEISRTRVALDRIRALGLQRTAAGSTPSSPAPFRGLQLDRVTYDYRRDDEDGVFTLGPISLDLALGELVFVIGGNGSGKTTLAKLLVGLYEPRSGQVRLNGQLVGSIERESYRQSFSAVFADFHLFQNLLGIPESARAQADELLGVLDLRHKVSIDATGRLSTTELSRGQQKRLALLTAYLEDRDVYVFDEWAADQDPAYKDVFYRHLLPELKARGKTVIAITHDDRYYHLADRCLRLELGRIAEDAATAARETA